MSVVRSRGFERWMRCGLERLPGRIARYGEAYFRQRTLRRLRTSLRRPTLIVTHDLSRSGAPLLVFEIAKILSSEGHAVVVASPKSGPYMSSLLDQGVEVLVDPSIASAPYLEQLAAACRVAICNTADTASVVVRIAAVAPVLWYLHEVSLLESRISDPMVREALRRASMIWAGSAMCADKITPLRSDVRVVPYGVDAIAAPPAAGTSSTLSIGVFGSVEQRKGQDLVVAAARMLPEETARRVRITLYGRILEPAFAEHVFADMAGTIVDYSGELDRRNYVAAMRNVDAVLVSSRDDTLPIVSIDALGIGRMLLLAPSVGTSNWLEDGTNALIAHATTAEAIRDLIVRAVDFQDRNALSCAAVDAFEKYFSPQAFRGTLLSAVTALEYSR